MKTVKIGAFGLSSGHEGAAFTMIWDRDWAIEHHRNTAKRQAREKLRSRIIIIGASFVAPLMCAAGYMYVSHSDTPAIPAVAMKSAPEKLPGEFACQVKSITDGDTLRCADDTRIRLHAVAAREKNETCSPGHPCPAASAEAATAKLSELASGQTLRCVQTGTSYNRMTAICRNEADVEINCAMVQSGTTVIWPKFNDQFPICNSSIGGR